MIFVTVGTQLPFDRLLEYFSEWQDNVGYTGKVVAQVGEGSQFRNSDIEIYSMLTSEEYYHWFCQADAIVSHAGMGSILSCLDYAKPGAFLARKHALSEHRNDHQVDTVKAFCEQYPSLEFCTEKEPMLKAFDNLFINNDDNNNLDSYRGGNDLGSNLVSYLKLRSSS